MRRALVVGGGIGGLASAIALRKVGFDVQVFEQSAELREVGAGVGLWSNAMASLDELGVGAAVRSGCSPLRVVAGANPSGAVVSRFDLDELGPDFAKAACFVALRPALLAALSAEVPSSDVHTGARVRSVAQDGETASLTFDDGRVEEGAVVIGADGIHSVIRPFIVGEDRVRYSGQTCFRGVAHMACASPKAVTEVQGRGQRCSVCPVTADTVYWWTAFNAVEGASVPVDERKAMLLDRYRGWPFGITDAIAATPDASILHNDLVDRAPARAYVRGSVALVGDAAHPTTPNLGQGANMAIDDAIVLARSLRDEPTIPAALERYQRERLPRTRLVVERSWSFGRMCLWDSAIGVALREAAVKLTPRSVMRDMLKWQILESVGPLV